MIDNDYIKINIGTSSYKNAGLYGLIYLLENENAIRGEDYIIDNQTLKINKDYFNNLDITNAYIKAHIKKFKETIYLTKLINNLEQLLTYDLKEELPKHLSEIPKKIIEFKKNRYKSALDNLVLIGSEEKEIFCKIEELIDWIDKNKKEIEKHELYLDKITEFKDLISTEIVFEYLAIADIKLQIKAFWDGISFMNKSLYKKDTKLLYNQNFVEPLREYTEDMNGTRICVECGRKTQDKFNLGFIGAINDVKKKTSNFWNMIENASVCPICAFLYTLMPLGYCQIGKDFLFINMNSSLDDLIKANKKTESFKEDKKNIKTYLYKKLTLLTLERYKSNPGIQINLITNIEKDSSYKKEQYIIDSNLIELFKEAKYNFENLYSKKVKIKNEFYDVYSEMINSLLNNVSLYYIIDLLLSNSISEGTDAGYLINLLNIEITKRNIKNKNKGDKKMTPNELSNKAFYHGKTMKKILLQDVKGSSKEKELDNKLRSRIYILNNSIRTENKEQFLDIIVNMYTAYGIAIPKMFIDCLNDSETFNIIGMAYLIGLKSNIEDKGDN